MIQRVFDLHLWFPSATVLDKVSVESHMHTHTWTHTWICTLRHTLTHSPTSIQDCEISICLAVEAMTGSAPILRASYPVPVLLYLSKHSLVPPVSLVLVSSSFHLPSHICRWSWYTHPQSYFTQTQVSMTTPYQCAQIVHSTAWWCFCENLGIVKNGLTPVIPAQVDEWI